MLQHQLRGTVHVLDDCTFKVTGFDMLEGKGVFWWAAESDSLKDMLDGWAVSSTPLTGPFNSQTLTVSLDNTTWDEMRILAVWSVETASNYGHVRLQFTEVPAGLAGAGVGAPGAPPPAPAPLENAPPGPPAPSPDPGLALPPPRFPHRPSPPALAPLSSPLVPPAPAPAPVAPPGPSFAAPPAEAPGPALPALKLGEPQPTMFENCMQLNHNYRVRWTVNAAEGMVDLGLEAVVGADSYLAFGWADPAAHGRGRLMGQADVAVTGFDSQDNPFVEDYFITEYKECDVAARAGVCPDTVLARRGGAGEGGGGRANSEVNNVELVHGQRLDGVSLIRYRRPLVSPDAEWDHALDPRAEMSVVWATGLLKAPDTRTGRALPRFHVGPIGAAYGEAVLRLGGGPGGGARPVNDCHTVFGSPGPDLGLAVVADRGSVFRVTAGDAAHYPNPPNASRAFYVNGHEAPVLKVERGVPVQFSVQAGHDCPLYITDDPVRATPEREAPVYAGGPDAHGVPAVPYELIWTPNGSTPNFVYYQSSLPKMGWLIQVVDGGLSDMYNKTAMLADQKVSLFWTLTDNQISFAVRGERPSGWLGLGLGGGMVNSFVYVGYVEEGVGKVGAYWIDGRDASNVHNWTEDLSLVKCAVADGRITFELSRPLRPAVCGAKCNVINRLEPLKVVWAYGAAWTSGRLSSVNMHTAMSSVATVIDLQSGEFVEEHLQPVFAVHGIMMFTSWGILMPFGVLAARYLKQNDWFLIHVYTQCAAIAVMILGLLFAMGELQGFDFSSTHSRIGITAFLLGLWQPLNAYFRPPKPNPPERPRLARVVWQWLHLLSGRAALLIGVVAMLSGIVTLGKESDAEYTVSGFAWGMVAWFVALAGVVVYNERWLSDIRWHEAGVLSFSEWRNGGGATHVTLDDEDDEGVDEDEEAARDLLPTTAGPAAPVSRSHSRASPEKAHSKGTEIELEAMR